MRCCCRLTFSLRSYGERRQGLICCVVVEWVFFSLIPYCVRCQERICRWRMYTCVPFLYWKVGRCIHILSSYQFGFFLTGFQHFLQYDDINLQHRVHQNFKLFWCAFVCVACTVCVYQGERVMFPCFHQVFIPLVFCDLYVVTTGSSRLNVPYLALNVQFPTLNIQCSFPEAILLGRVRWCYALHYQTVWMTRNVCTLINVIYVH